MDRIVYCFLGLYTCITNYLSWFLDKRGLLMVKVFQTQTLQGSHACLFCVWIPFVKGWKWCWRYPRIIPTSHLKNFKCMGNNKWRPTGTVNTFPLLSHDWHKWDPPKDELHRFHSLDWSIYHVVMCSNKLPTYNNPCILKTIWCKQKIQLSIFI